MNRLHPLIKICGIRTPEDARVASEAGADVVGLVQAQGSPRLLDGSETTTILDQLPERLDAIPVFTNPSSEDVLAIPTRWIQLHGEESPDDVARIAMRTGRRIIRGIPFDHDACQTWAAHPNVDILLIDGARAGSGQAFDHDHLVDLLPTLRVPTIIAGGLDPDSVHRLLQTVQPFGVDVSSGVESSRGTKDHGLIRSFCQAVRDAG